jgi:redox-regulated HSP33 family molecular chaperone
MAENKEIENIEGAENINFEEQKRALQTRDRVVKVLSENKKFRITILKNTKAAQEAQRRHQLDVLPAFMTSRAMAAASMYAAFLKSEERVIIDVDGDGPISRVYAEAIHVGEVRSFVEFAKDSEKIEIPDLSSVLGQGTFTLTRILENKNEPLKSITQLQQGDIASEMIVYYVQSEQVPTYVYLPVEFDEATGQVTQSGGIMAQAMPGYDDSDIEEMVKIFENMPNILEMYERDMNPKDVLKEVLPFDFTLLGSTAVDFFCRCNKESFKDKLVTLGPDELKAMQKDGHNELVCQYCNTRYTLDDEDFEAIIESAQAKRN